MELADTSAWIWTHRAGGSLRAEFAERVVDGEIGTCDMVRLELLYGVRNPTESSAVRAELRALPDCPIGKRNWLRAIDVYDSLAQQGGLHQRSVGHADLLIAAAAEGAGATLLHYDEDFDRIAAVTGQPTRWIAPRGSLS